MTTTLQSAFWFAVAGLCEIGGGYLIWQWLREKKTASYGLIGAVVISLYGVIPTLQPYHNFGRIYAAYGGWFIVLSLLWGWRVNGKTPDRFDALGALICLFGAAVIMYAPRGGEG